MLLDMPIYRAGENQVYIATMFQHTYNFAKMANAPHLEETGLKQ